MRQSPSRAVGQLVIATYRGAVPPRSILGAVRAGHVGSIILMGNNTVGGVIGTRRAVNALQRAARAGGNPGLLIMTDQEGGEVRRLPGPPDYSAAVMGSASAGKPALAGAQGYATALMLRRAGVNVDLAPVADVRRADGFIAVERRSFGPDPASVARSACAFARGLERGGVAYTLKHFPGLGDAVKSTDLRPVAISEPAALIHADDAAYRACGGDRLALVMVSSASYTHLTGRLPAIFTPSIFSRVLPADGVSALTVSDTLQSGAIRPYSDPGRRAIAAGDDMVMYPNTEHGALAAYTRFAADLRDGSLSVARVRAAATRVLALKRALGLG